MRCNHKWIKDREVKRYWDFSGTEVVVFECHCEYCERRQKRKYVGDVIGQWFGNFSNHKN